MDNVSSAVRSITGLKKCPQKDESKTEKISTSTESTAVVEKTNKRRLVEYSDSYKSEDVSEPTPSKQRKVEKTAEPKKTKRRIPKKKHCFICKSKTHDAKTCDEIALDPEDVAGITYFALGLFLRHSTNIYSNKKHNLIFQLILFIFTHNINLLISP